VAAQKPIMSLKFTQHCAVPEIHVAIPTERRVNRNYKEGVSKSKVKKPHVDEEWI